MSIKRNPMIYVFNMDNSSAQQSVGLKVVGTHLVLFFSCWDISADQGNNPRSETDEDETWDWDGTSSP